MRIVEPKQLYDRYGHPLNQWENAVTDEDAGTIEPLGCCADLKERCKHSSPEEAHANLVHYHGAKSYRLKEKRWLPNSSACRAPGCAELGNYEVEHADERIVLCTTHCNEEGVRKFVEETEQQKREVQERARTGRGPTN